MKDKGYTRAFQERRVKGKGYTEALQEGDDEG